MNWCFAIVNNKLAEIYFEKKKNSNPEITNHCYIRKEEYKTKREQNWIEKDTKKLTVIFRKGKYKIIQENKRRGTRVV